MIAPDTTNNSFYLQIDGGCAEIVGDSSTLPADSLTWVKYKDGNTATSITANLAAGNHTIKITEREGGVGIDKLILVTDAACVPTGDGNNCQVVPTPTPVGCTTSSTTWQNESMTAHTGILTHTFEATPNATNIDNVFGLSNGSAAAYADIATAVRFNTTGTIDARNGSAYAAVSPVTYSAGTKYAFRVIVNIPSHTYSVYVKSAGSQTENLIAQDYAFRTEQAAVTSLNNIAMFAGVGSATRCAVQTVSGAVYPTGSATLGASPASNSVTAGVPFTVDVVVNGGGNAFNAAQATATTSANLSVTGLSTPAANACNLTYAGTPPSMSNPSFAGAILSSSSTQCTVYTLTITPLTSGIGTITFTNASVKAFSDNRELLASVQNGTINIAAAPTATPAPTAAPVPTAEPTQVPGQTTTILNPTDDATVDAAFPTTNYGTATTLTSDGDPLKVIYMKYDLAALAGRTLVSAKLRMRVSDAATNSHFVKSVANTTWTEETITYNTRPAVGGSLYTISNPVLGALIEADITNTITGLLGQKVSLAVDSVGTEGYGFNSKENTTDKVSLVLVTMPGTPTTVPTAIPTAVPTAVPTATPIPTAVPTAIPTPTPTVPGPTPTTVPLTAPSIGSIESPTYKDSTIIAGSKVPSLAKVFVNNTSTSVVIPNQTSWQRPYMFTPGENIIQVFGEDALGNRTTVTTTTVIKHELSDINGDNTINLTDISLFSVDWLKTTNLVNKLSDMNEDGIVNLTDFSIIAKRYGQ
jgi:hypothetical protein